MEDNFLVSARKYRPAKFSDVVGQEKITQTLKNAINSNHLAHAYLFNGTRGVGKTTMARILAKTINCENRTSDGEACGQCASCVSFGRNASFNVFELDAASKNSVEDIRNLVEQVGYPPQGAKFKVFIIDEVHMLSIAAFNAFLKTLEEPPAYAKFILATTEKHKIPMTILSRCQVYDFKKISVSDIQTHLKGISKQESIEADDNALNMIAIKADGGLRDALSIFDRLISLNENKLTYEAVISSLNILDYDYYFKLIEAVKDQNHSSALLILDEIIQNGFELDIMLQGFADHVRNLWVAQKDKTLVLLDTTDEIKDRYINQSKAINEATLLNFLTLITDTEKQIKYAQNKRLTTEVMLLKMCYIPQLIETSWTDVGEKKKPSSVIEKKESESESDLLIISSKSLVDEKPKSSQSNNLIDINTLHKLAKDGLENKKTQFQKVEITPIENKFIWHEIIKRFNKNEVQKETFLSNPPQILNDTFLFTVTSSVEANLYSTYFSSLDEIYFDLTAKKAHWKCEIVAPQAEIDMTKKEIFDNLKRDFPIMDKIQKDFKLDFS